MAYMKDSTGRRLDSIAVPATTEVAPATIVSPPTGFALASLTMPTVRRLGGGRFATNTDALIDALRPAAGVTYYVAPTGTVGADGLTALTPTTLPTAIAKADVGTIIFAPGEYWRENHSTTTITKDLNLIASGPGVRITGWNTPTALTWTLYGGAIYQTTRSGTVGVIDVTTLTAWGDYTNYQQMANVGSIVAAGQWAVSGSTVYVWALGSADLSNSTTRSNVRLAINTHVGFEVVGTTIYAEGITIEGCNSAANGGLGVSNGNGTILARDCRFTHNAVTNGFSMLGGKSILVRCVASSNFADGFNYHQSSGGIYMPDFIEVDCIGHHNGLLSGLNNNNGSTSHETARGIRVGGRYYACQGPTVTDVGSAKSWNLGCVAEAPTVAFPCWALSTGAAAEMWLDECGVIASSTALAYSADLGAMHLHRPRATDEFAMRVSATTGGTVSYYTA